MSKCECKECLHYDVCYDRIEFGETHDFKGENGDCDHYKSKSLFVELPCKVGDTIYEIRNSKIFNEKIVEMRVIAITFLVSSCCKHLSITAENSRGANLLFELDDFGKTVFLTKEDAERKLREVGE
ncbi:MAG: hypothetical protein IJW19_05105 [Clostridia bacterium]|nr:hypothetical protein [Clostridia bacterium]